MAVNSRLRALIGNPSRIGLGGEGVLRTNGRDLEALAMLEAAYASGIRYYDSAQAYAGSEQYLGHFWAQHPERKDLVFQTSKSARREADGAARDLSRSLSRIGLDRLDLWQMHDLRERDDIRRIEGAGGALRTFYNARETGTTRGIGVTGHYDPMILLHAVTNWDIDSVLIPVNPIEAALGGFLDRVIPAARARGIGVIGMKVLGAGNYPEAGLSPGRLIRFALSQDVDLVIVGCSTPSEAQFLARQGEQYQPMDEEEQTIMVDEIRPYVKRFAYYRGVI